MNDWFIVVDGVRVGPKTTSEIDAALADGSVRPDTLAWTEGQTEWKPISSLGVFQLPSRVATRAASAVTSSGAGADAPRRGSAKILDLVGALATPVGLAFACLFTLVLVGFLIAWMFSFRSPVKAPTAAELESVLKASSEGGESFTDLDLRRKLEREYGEDLSALLKEHGLPAGFYDALIADLGLFDEKYRDLFIDGLERVLKSRGKQVEAGLVNAYRQEFRSRLVKAEAGAMELTLRRSVFAVGAAISMVAVFGFLIVPLLVQVERNTRAAQPG